MLGIRGPFGTGWDVTSGKGGDVVFVAGGIGLAPLRPAILELCAARADYGRVLLLYGARTPEDILFGDDLRRWAADHGVDVQVTVDNGQHAWRGRVGPGDPARRARWLRPGAAPSRWSAGPR